MGQICLWYLRDSLLTISTVIIFQIFSEQLSVPSTVALVLIPILSAIDSAVVLRWALEVSLFSHLNL